ncbi:M56 family metallopeptidase [Wenyingzhuangia marina]|uniref:Signal transducer regulating beta-lactamase production, contains metallopeptidase domain n=1 Tax=Wenyingzhuangia marina TaxID=1195760 RepID=A0A1M5V2H6_9FLAO|nr:M56 family metallopeptidase [Wenyingzhuangia marina]GGF74905.1 cell envelope biogenesis protein TonB [Wenyingzhuangia marina]SHH69419.1 Signal transducer regulating beta-lactamase production, contains metallopeptidase domain [Wenyingzhuangia marina]
MIYILEIIMFQMLFLALYYMFKNETFFNYNRIYLLGTSVLSYVLPFVKFDAFRTTSLPINTINMLPTVFIGDTTQNLVNNTNTNSFSWDWWYLLLLGSTVMLVIFTVKLWKLIKLSKNELVTKSEEVRLVTIKNSQSAFSFFNWIFMGDQLKGEEREIILAHELIHVKQKHSVDLLFFEIQRIVCWFNPLVYQYQKEIQSLHEFIVDNQMIQKSGKQEYCKNILTQLLNVPKLSFVNTFYKKSIIKKRIAMITKKESKSTARLKYAFIIPVLMGMLFYTSCQQNEKEVEEQVLELKDGKVFVKENISETAKRDMLIEGVPFAAVQNPAVFPGCEDAEDLKKCFSDKVSKYISQNFDIGLAEELGLTGVQRMAGMFKVDVNGNVTDIKVRSVNPDLKEEFERVLESLPQMEPATHDGEKVSMLFSLPLVFKVDAKTEEKK